MHGTLFIPKGCWRHLELLKSERLKEQFNVKVSDEEVRKLT